MTRLDQIPSSSDMAIDALSALATAKTKRFQNQRFAGPTTNGGTVTIFTDVGAGIIRYLWLAVNSAFMALDGRLQVFTDGNATPDIDIDLGTLFLAHNDANTQANGAMMSTPHWHGETSGGSIFNTAGSIKFPIPYSNGVVVKLLNPTGAATGNNTFYAQIDYQDGATAPYRLKSIGRSWAGGSIAGPVLGGALTIPAANAQTLFDITVPKPGWLVWTGFAEKAGAGQNWSFLERDIQLTVDAEATPSWRTSGTEDFFGGAFYYAAHQANAWGVLDMPSHGAAFISTANYTHNAGLDHLDQCGGVMFNSELKMDLLTEAATLVQHQMSHVSLYYQSQ